MASQISTEDLVTKVKSFILTNPNEKGLDHMIKESIIKVDRDIRKFDSLHPLAWDIQPYSGLRTVCPANISGITQADPAVFTAASVDTDITGHGFDNHSTITDIVTIDGIVGDEDSNNIEALNGRQFLFQYVSATTFTLKTLDGLDALSTSSLTEYSSGGYIYHSGYVLNTTTILASVDSQWTFKKILPCPRFDGHPTEPISNPEDDDGFWLNISNAQRPRRWRYWQNMASPSSVSHYLFWYPAANNNYNLAFHYQREIPDISTWSSSTYPFHPPEVHDAIWHGALAELIGLSKRMERQGEKGIVIRMEVMFAEHWMSQFAQDRINIINLSRSMMGAQGGGGMTG
ncbi:MAG TPA: hypothetical protein VMW90_03050 [Acidobacteriota bacterium]|nr:hypothetical protein [Acidobacteriota bacterium]